MTAFCTGNNFSRIVWRRANTSIF